ncbi:F-box protein At2g17690-like [Macadamia integrifolia]|uniref:F-box protein At2g17690-like n=1 Tax=Macadamia integrifolia TaxID=60698 RepID=UPI001C4F96EC|nr:F-box protein At2g17690-like [Macadamia integrifolia]
MKKHDAATWSKLPEKILEIIVWRLPCFLDHVRFGAVCQLWQSTIVNMHHHLTSWDPWLLLPEREDNCMIRGFYKFSKRSVFEVKAA